MKLTDAARALLRDPKWVKATIDTWSLHGNIGQLAESDSPQEVQALCIDIRAFLRKRAIQDAKENNYE